MPLESVGRLLFNPPTIRLPVLYWVCPRYPGTTQERMLSSLEIPTVRPMVPMVPTMVPLFLKTILGLVQAKDSFKSKRCWRWRAAKWRTTARQCGSTSTRKGTRVLRKTWGTVVGWGTPWEAVLGMLAVLDMLAVQETLETTAKKTAAKHRTG